MTIHRDSGFYRRHWAIIVIVVGLMVVIYATNYFGMKP